MGQVHRVTREPRAKIVKLPRDGWKGRTFVEADGTELISKWSGRGALPWAEDWPIGGAKDDQEPARIHLPRSPE